jgi:hypothetical protein
VLLAHGKRHLDHVSLVDAITSTDRLGLGDILT